MWFDLYWKNDPILHVEWDGSRIESSWINENHHHARFISPKIRPGQVSIRGLLDYCTSRQAPPTRDGIEDILKKYSITEYQPITMCRKSNGITMKDFFWMKFDDSVGVTYDKIKLRD